MNSLPTLRSLCDHPAAAVRWACLLEASAPKAGNVFPGHSFEDLRFRDFVEAAEITAEAFAGNSASFSCSVHDACTQVSASIGTNVNLGILLLLGPLVQADSIEQRLAAGPWRERIRDVLSGINAEDSARLYAAINAVGPGGMGRESEMDLSGPPPQDFLQAMQAASGRDRIATNYADGFRDLFENVLPVVEAGMAEQGDLLEAIARSHLELLRREPDTLISRKFGLEVALDVQKRAGFDHEDADQRREFDQFLRAGTVDLKGDRSRLNPGTTADLIAAALYVLLRKAAD